MLETHEQRPQWLVLGDRRMMIRQAGMRFDDPPHGGVDLLAVGVNLLEARPEHFILGHVIPAHFVHTGFKQPLEVGIEWFGDQPGNPQLVGVQGRGMAVVENHWMAQVMIGRTIERLLALKPGEQDFGQCPAIVEIIQRLGACTSRQIGQRQRGQRPVRLAAGAIAGGASGPPPGGARTSEFAVKVAAQVATPGFSAVFQVFRGGEGRDHNLSLSQLVSEAQAIFPSVSFPVIARTSNAGLIFDFIKVPHQFLNHGFNG